MNVGGAAYRHTMNDSIELFQSQDGTVNLEVRTDGETVWLTQQQLAALFGRDVTVIRRHISNARREELAGLATSAKFALVQQEGSREVERQVEHYNLDMILSVGYRVKSPEGVHFRRWATETLRRYLVDALHAGSGAPRISNNALAALTLLVAMSDPAEKDLMVALIIRMLTEEAA